MHASPPHHLPTPAPYHACEEDHDATSDTVAVHKYPVGIRNSEHAASRARISLSEASSPADSSLPVAGRRLSRLLSSSRSPQESPYRDSSARLPNDEPSERQRTPTPARRWSTLSARSGQSAHSRSSSRSEGSLAAARAEGQYRQARLARVDRVVLQEREREERSRIRTLEEDIFIDYLVPFYQLLHARLWEGRSSSRSGSNQPMQPSFCFERRRCSGETPVSGHSLRSLSERFHVFHTNWAAASGYLDSVDGYSVRRTDDTTDGMYCTKDQRWVDGDEPSSSVSPSLRSLTTPLERSFAPAVPRCGRSAEETALPAAASSSVLRPIAHKAATTSGQAAGLSDGVAASFPARQPPVDVVAVASFESASPEPRKPVWSPSAALSSTFARSAELMWMQIYNPAADDAPPPASARTEAPDALHTLTKAERASTPNSSVSTADNVQGAESTLVPDGERLLDRQATSPAGVVGVLSSPLSRSFHSFGSPSVISATAPMREPTQAMAAEAIEFRVDSASATTVECRNDALHPANVSVDEAMEDSLDVSPQTPAAHSMPPLRSVFAYEVQLPRSRSDESSLQLHSSSDSGLQERTYTQRSHLSSSSPALGVQDGEPDNSKDADGATTPVDDHSDDEIRVPALRLPTAAFKNAPWHLEPRGSGELASIRERSAHIPLPVLPHPTHLVTSPDPNAMTLSLSQATGFQAVPHSIDSTTGTSITALSDVQTARSCSNESRVDSAAPEEPSKPPLQALAESAELAYSTPLRKQQSPSPRRVVAPLLATPVRRASLPCWVGTFAALQAEESVARASLGASEYYEWAAYLLPMADAIKKCEEAVMPGCGF